MSNKQTSTNNKTKKLVTQKKKPSKAPVTKKPTVNPATVGGGVGGTFMKSLPKPCGVAGLAPCIGIISPNPNGTCYCAHISDSCSMRTWWTPYDKIQKAVRTAWIEEKIKSGLGNHPISKRTFYVMTGMPKANATLAAVLEVLKGAHKVINKTGSQGFKSGFYLDSKGSIHPLVEPDALWACGWGKDTKQAQRYKKMPNNKINGDGVFEVPDMKKFDKVVEQVRKAKKTLASKDDPALKKFRPALAKV
mmetsp:Transcript_23718/g.26305  ORF Transcript_23718/g.26305 Transcript_23718/m.26305 type:complete len:248 (+) Transcript_23718:21-764(+)